MGSENVRHYALVARDGRLGGDVTESSDSFAAVSTRSAQSPRLSGTRSRHRAADGHRARPRKLHEDGIARGWGRARGLSHDLEEPACTLWEPSTATLAVAAHHSPRGTRWRGRPAVPVDLSGGRRGDREAIEVRGHLGRRRRFGGGRTVTRGSEASAASVVTMVSRWVRIQFSGRAGSMMGDFRPSVPWGPAVGEWMCEDGVRLGQDWPDLWAACGVCGVSGQWRACLRTVRRNRTPQPYTAPEIDR